jgi:hypothetical protein
MVDFVPLARVRRETADGDFQPISVGEFPYFPTATDKAQQWPDPPED